MKLNFLRTKLNGRFEQKFEIRKLCIYTAEN